MRVSLAEHLVQVLFSLPPDVQVAFVTVDHAPKLCPSDEVERVSAELHLEHTLFSVPAVVQPGFTDVYHEP